MAVTKCSRIILWCLTFIAFVLNYALTANLNMAIVAMVPPKIQQLEPVFDSGACFTRNLFNTTVINVTAQVSSNKINWNEKEQNRILGSFYWFHWMTHLLGGVLSHKYGGKKVLGLSQLVASVACLAIPFAAHAHIYLVIFLRSLQGALMGCTFSSFSTLVGKWAPPDERSKFFSAIQGYSFGSTITYPITGYLISWFGWEFVFYICGGIGIFWFILWWLLAFDSPADHPYISRTEKEYIEKSLGHTSEDKKLPIPWTHMLLSLPLWSCVISLWGAIWARYTIVIYAPMYFSMVHGLTTRASGLLSGLPSAGKFVFGFVFSFGSDYLLSREIMSRTNVRKLASAINTIGQGACLAGIIFAGCNSTLAAVLMAVAMACNGANVAVLANFVDISPNFSGVCQGIGTLVSFTSGFGIPIVVGALTQGNQTMAQWDKVFLIGGGIAMAAGVLHLFTGKAEVQYWNSPVDKEETEEINPLKVNIEK